MKKVSLNYLVDVFAFVEFVFLATTGVLLFYTLPPGSGRFTTVWGLDRHDWGEVHLWVAVALFSTLALHLVLHWQWLVNLTRGREREKVGLRLALGLVGMVMVLAMAAAPLLAPVEKAEAQGQYGKRLHQPAALP